MVMHGPTKLPNKSKRVLTESNLDAFSTISGKSGQVKINVEENSAVLKMAPTVPPPSTGALDISAAGQDDGDARAFLLLPPPRLLRPWYHFFFITLEPIDE